MSKVRPVHAELTVEESIPDVKGKILRRLQTLKGKVVRHSRRDRGRVLCLWEGRMPLRCDGIPSAGIAVPSITHVSQGPEPGLCPEVFAGLNYQTR